MTDNAQKTPLAASLQGIAQRAAMNAIDQLGMALPCSVVSVDPSGCIVTVKFEVNLSPPLPQVTVPVLTSQYNRAPFQVGDKGVVFPLSVSNAGISGLGTGTPDLTRPGNLAALQFIPVGNKNFSANDDPNKYLIYGPDGVIIRSVSTNAKIVVGDTTISITATGDISIDTPTGNFEITATTITLNGAIVFNGIATGPSGGPVQIHADLDLVGDINQTGDQTSSGTITGTTDVVAGTISGKTHTHPYLKPATGTTTPTGAPT